jgi:hypothetical protein
VPAWPLFVLVRRIEQCDPEVLAGLEVDLTSEQVEDDQQRPLRDLPRFLDLRAHLPNLPRAAQTGFGQARGERGLRIATPVPQRMIEQRLDDPPGLLDRVLAG